MSKPIACVDFDGVLHAYDSGWRGAGVVADGPVPGAMEWLRAMTIYFDTQVYSSRSKEPDGVWAMRCALAYWAQQEFPDDFGMTPQEWPEWFQSLKFPTEKPAAFITIDDRAICFRGRFDVLEPSELLKFKPWNKREGVGS